MLKKETEPLDSLPQPRERQKMRTQHPGSRRKGMCMCARGVTTHHPAQVRGTGPNTCLPLLLGDSGCCLRKARSKEGKSVDVASPFPKPR